MSQDLIKITLVSINIIMIWLLFVPYILYFFGKKKGIKNDNTKDISSLTIKLIPIIIIVGFMILMSALSIIPIVVENYGELPNFYKLLLSQKWAANYGAVAIVFNISLVLVEITLLFKFLSNKKWGILQDKNQ